MSVISRIMTVAEDGDRLSIEFPYDPKTVEFCRSLPESRWHAKEKRWSCARTPQTIRRIRTQAPIDVEFDVETMGYLSTYGKSLAIAHEARARDSDLLDQPEIRRADSWAPQLRAYHFIRPLPAAMIDVAMGGGKSKVPVDLVQNLGVDDVLILCPTSCVGVWRREFEKWTANEEVDVEVLVLEKGTTADRAMKGEAFLRGYRSSSRIVVVNYEAAAYRWKSTGKLALWLKSREWDVIIADEVHRLKGHATDVSKFAASLKSRRRYGLTGTVLPHSPADAFGQFRFLDPGIFGTSWTRFKSEYCIENPYIKGAIAGYKNEDDLAARMDEITIRITEEELGQNLPGITHTDLTCDLRASTLRIYRKLERDFVAATEDGVTSADNVLVKLLRLQQLTGGSLQYDEDETPTDVDDAKENLLADRLSDLPTREPVVVFCRFSGDLRRVERVAGKLGRRYGELSGSRRDLTDHATYPEDVDVLGVQVQSGGVGIDLTRAAYVFAYSLGSLSPGDYDQLVKRVDRPGQERHVTMYHLVASGTVDEALYVARIKRRKVIDAVLDQLKNTEADDD